MQSVYSFLGLVASVNERMSRKSINFIPYNQMITIVLMIVIMIGWLDIKIAFLDNRQTSIDQPILLAWILTMCAITLVIWNWVYFLQYVVFQKTQSNLLTESPFPVSVQRSSLKSEIYLRTTSRFELKGNLSRRFVNVTAKLEITKNGEFVLLSKTDALTSFINVKLLEPVGLWYVLLPPKNLLSVEAGLQYFGMGGPRPALRIKHISAANKKKSVTILSFSNEKERKKVINLLTRNGAVV